MIYAGEMLTLQGVWRVIVGVEWLSLVRPKPVLAAF
jgi:hypothetical protein